MHYTAVNYAESKRILVEQGGLSSHYLIPMKKDKSYPSETIEIFQLVDEAERAWHAGVSEWQGRTGLNDTSIGIEIVNIPTCDQYHLQERHSEPEVTTESHTKTEPICTYPDFEPEQINALVELTQGILKRNPDIHPTAIVGHSDISPSRKQDPGPRFPWYTLYQNGIGAWYDHDTLARHWRAFEANPPSLLLLQRALRSYGYGILGTGNYDQQTRDTIRAFQTHFLPWQVTGKPDSKTSAAIFALLEKYFPSKFEVLIDHYIVESDAEIKNTRSKPETGQIDSTINTQNITGSRSNLLNSFKAYRGMGDLIIETDRPASATFIINGEQLNISDPLLPETEYSFNLKRRTKDGLNTLEISGVTPANTNMRVVVPYPTLNDKPNIPNHLFSKTADYLANISEQTDVTHGLLISHKGTILKNRVWGQNENTLFKLDTMSDALINEIVLQSLLYEKKLDLDLPINFFIKELDNPKFDTIIMKDLLKGTIENIFPSFSMVVQNITKQSLNIYAQDHIINPLNLTNTKFETGFEGVNHAHGRLVSDLEDLAILSQLFLNGGGYGRVKLFENNMTESLFSTEYLASKSSIPKLNRVSKNQDMFGKLISDVAYGYSGENNLLIIDPITDLFIIYLSDSRFDESHIETDKLINSVYKSILHSLQ